MPIQIKAMTCTLTPFRNQVLRFVDICGGIKYGEPIFDTDLPFRRVTNIKRTDGSIVSCNNQIKLLPPVDPPQIFCVGLNYKDHCAEVNMDIPKAPIIFYKLPQSVIGDSDTIVIPKCAQGKPEVDYEAELAVIIGKRGKDILEENALDYVYGYTTSNDVSARRWQGIKNGNQWSRCKSFDSFCPLGPVVTSPALITDPQNLRIQTRVNSLIKQSSNTNQMIFGVAKLIAEISRGTTLLPGAVILTGTPPGVAMSTGEYLKENDVVEIEIEKISSLKNVVKNDI